MASPASPIAFGLPGKLTIRVRAADHRGVAGEHPVRGVLAGGEPHRLGDSGRLAIGDVAASPPG